jgi:hypothetical protein
MKPMKIVFLKVGEGDKEINRGGECYQSALLWMYGYTAMQLLLYNEYTL